MTIERSLRIVEVPALESPSPLVLDGTSRVSDAIREMRDRGLGYALITDDDQLVGIFTERDVFLTALDNEQTLQRFVGRAIAT